MVISSLDSCWENSQTFLHLPFTVIGRIQRVPGVLILKCITWLQEGDTINTVLSVLWNRISSCGWNCTLVAVVQNSPSVGSSGRGQLRSNREPACHLPPSQPGELNASPVEHIKTQRRLQAIRSGPATSRTESEKCQENRLKVVCLCCQTLNFRSSSRGSSMVFVCAHVCRRVAVTWEAERSSERTIGASCVLVFGVFTG